MRIGVDLGGTKIEAIALDGEGGEILRERVATPAGDYRGTLEAVAELANRTISRAQARQRSAALPDAEPPGLGIGIPGAISPVTGLVKNANSTCLIGERLDRDLEAACGRPVRLANDADCFALSEATDGAAAGSATVFGVILGTGVGGGIVSNGRLFAGPNRIAGEWGHNPLPIDRADGDGVRREFPGEPCYCGRRGCIETWLSGPALARDYDARGGSIKGGASAVAIAAAADGGDVVARDVLRDYADRLARALAVVVNILDPDAIVLGGGLSNLRYLYEAVPRLWARHVFSDHVATRLLPPKHGDSSGVRGAAWLWPPGGDRDRR